MRHDAEIDRQSGKSTPGGASAILRLDAKLQGSRGKRPLTDAEYAEMTERIGRAIFGDWWDYDVTHATPACAEVIPASEAVFPPESNQIKLNQTSPPPTSAAVEALTT